MWELWEIGEEREACGALSRCQERRGGNVAEQGEAGTGCGKEREVTALGLKMTNRVVGSGLVV